MRLTLRFALFLLLDHIKVLLLIAVHRFAIRLFRCVYLREHIRFILLCCAHKLTLRASRLTLNIRLSLFKAWTVLLHGSKHIEVDLALGKNLLRLIRSVFVEHDLPKCLLLEHGGVLADL